MRKILLIILLLASSEALAQRTIFNVPSADITKKNKIFLQHESAIRAHGQKKFLATTNYAAYGIGNDTEIDVTLFNLNSPASQNVTVSPGFKKTLQLAENSYKPKVTVGFMTPISLQKNGVGHWIYGTGSFVIPQTKTRLTGGISSGTKQIFGQDVTSFIGGIEHELTHDLNLIADWYSGKHNLGNLAAGFSYELPKEISLYLGYQISNSKRVAGNSIVLEIARDF